MRYFYKKKYDVKNTFLLNLSSTARIVAILIFKMMMSLFTTFVSIELAIQKKEHKISRSMCMVQ